MKRISSHYLLTPGGLLPDRIVTVDGEGVITDISQTGRLDREAGVEFYPGIIVPGFVNAHCHLELSHLKGAIPPGGGFTAFARGMREARKIRNYDPMPSRESSSLELPRREIGGRSQLRITNCEDSCQHTSPAEFWDAKMWSEGVSAVGDVCNGASTFALKPRSRIHYRNSIEIFGIGADPARAFALRDEATAKGLPASVTPHSLYSLDLNAFAEAVGNFNSASQDFPHRGSAETASSLCSRSAASVQLPALDSRLSIHFMESEEETELFRRKGRLWDWYAEQNLKPDFLDYGSPAERLTAQVPADRAVMLVHNCRVTQRDIDIVMEHFTAPVTWVLCPGSNRYISRSEPPVELLRKNRLRIAVGTDSLASNTTLSMVAELGFFNGVALPEILEWATLNGAEALGLDATLGSIETGKSPGLVVLSGVDLENMTLTPAAQARRII